MDLRQLEYFAAVARHRHFRRAAEDLYVTQSAVSQQVKRLEAELGVALLRRTARNPPVELTAAGEELLARAETILATVADARAAMDAHAGALRGGVRVAATTGDAVGLAARLARFGHEHPGVRIALRQGTAEQVLDLVATGSVDLAVAALTDGAAAGRGVESTALAGEPLVLIAAPEDPLSGAGAVRLWDVRERPFVLADPGSALRAAVLAACARDGFGPVPLFEAGDPAAIRELVHAGLAVAVVPASWARLAGPVVGVAGLAAPAPRHALSLVTRAGATPSPAARLLGAHLRAELG